MYHPTRGGVRGGRDQFSWDDVKVDKHRENYLGHSLKAPVGRWQKGKDLHWYARDKGSKSSDAEAAKEEIRRIKEEEEQAMREALGLAPKRASRPQGNRLDKHEFSELVKRGSTAEDVGAGHAEAANIHGLGFTKSHRPHVDSDIPLLSGTKEEVPPEIPRAPIPNPSPAPKNVKEDSSSEEESSRKKRRREERKLEKREKRERHSKRERNERRRHSPDDRRKHDKRRRHHSESD